MIDRITIKSLSEIKPWRSITVICGEWFLILLPLILIYHHWSWWLYLILIFWIGGRQHALGILIHEAAHYRLFSNKWVNDIVSELFLAYPLFVSTGTYRKNHFAHHHFLNTTEDPDWVAKDNYEWQFPQPRAFFLKTLAKEFCGNFVLQIQKRLWKKKRSAIHAGTRSGNNYIFPSLKVAFYMLLIFVLFYFHMWQYFLLCWVIPLITWNSVALKIRSIAEHSNLTHLPPEARTRTTYPTTLERLFIVSHNVGYHTAHHLYPSIPYYNLPLIHQMLEEQGYPMHINHSYMEVLKECME